jgi:hypothetical protein
VPAAGNHLEVDWDFEDDIKGRSHTAAFPKRSVKEDCQLTSMED